MKSLHDKQWRGDNPFSPKHPWLQNREVLLTADEHYFHANIIKYCSRPFDDVITMNNVISERHNEIASDRTTTVHIGDACLGGVGQLIEIVSNLRGKHLFMDGSHDEPLRELATVGIPDNLRDKMDFLPKLYEFMHRKEKITLCHYKMETFWCSHYRSWSFFGHSHGNRPNTDRSKDVGVDTNNFYPYRLLDLILT